MKQIVRSSLGFSLIEALVVVAMVSILAAIAVPNFQTMVVQSRRSEARVGLGRIYQSLRTFRAEWGSYTWCLDEIGGLPHTADRRYFVGFANGNPANLNVCGPTANYNCVSKSYFTPAPGSGADLCDATTRIDAAGSTYNCFGVHPVDVMAPLDSWGFFDATRDTFRASAIGIIRSGQIDVWSIDQNKNIVNVQDGT